MMVSPQASQPPSGNYLLALWPYFRQTLGQLVLGAVSGILMNTIVVLPAILLGKAVDSAESAIRGTGSAGDVAMAGLALAGATALYQLARVGKRYWLRTGYTRMLANIRSDALRGVLSWPLARLQSVPIGDLMARVVGDVDVLGVGIREVITESWDTVLFSISLIVAMLSYDVRLTLLALLPVPLAMWLAYAVGGWVRGRTTAARAANSALTTALQEKLAGLRVLRLFGRAADAVSEVDELARAQATANLSLARLRGGLQPIYNTLMTSGVILVLWLGGERVVAGTLTLGAFIAYLELYLRFVGRGFRIPQLVNSIQGGGAAYQRIWHMLAPAVPRGKEARFSSFRAAYVDGMSQLLPSASSSGPSGPAPVELREVTFAYTGSAEPALRDLDLKVAAGSMVGITGPVGSGKSALARALLGLYPLRSGAIMLDGLPIESISAVERALRIGYLPQDPELFAGTVEENVALWRDPAERSGTAISAAIHCAALDDDIACMVDGLQTQIGERGVRVSGGQRQRIGLARALSSASPRSPGLLILDDPFSAVDVDTEAKIIAALGDAYGPNAPPEQRATILLFSHRLAAFAHADLVVVLSGGKIVEQGTHGNLLRDGGLYARIYRAQSRAASRARDGGAS